MAGPSTGRGFKRSGPTPPVSEAPPENPTPSLSPFQQYAPNAAQLDAAAGRTDSRQVLAIVGALGFMMAAALVIVGVAAVGIVTMTNIAAEQERLAALNRMDEAAGVIIMDTGVVPVAIVKEKPTPKAKVVDTEEEVDPRDAMPTIAPGTIILRVDGALFHSIEVNCPQNQIRTRAAFRNGRAVARGLPTNETCNVTFQGSAPVYTQLRGGETRTCTSISPVICR